MKAVTILGTIGAAAVAGAQEVTLRPGTSGDFTWTVSSEYVSFLKNSVCKAERGECYWCSTSGDACAECANECATNECASSCVATNDSSGSPSSEILTKCDIACCVAVTDKDETECSTAPTTNAPTVSPPVLVDDGGDDDTRLGDDDDTTGYVPDCRCVWEDDFPFWNLLTEGDFSQSNVDVEGNLAVGGSMTVENYGVGVSLDDEADGTTWHLRDGLRVGGDLNFAHGTVYHGDTVYGGSLAMSNTNFADGIEESSTVADDIEADLAVIRETSDRLSYNAWYYDSYNDASFDWGCETNNAFDDQASCQDWSRIVFDGRNSVARGPQDNDGNLRDTGIHYFNVKASDLVRANSQGMYILHDVNPSASLYVINVEDDSEDQSISLSNFQIWVDEGKDTSDSEQRTVANRQTLWNFNKFTSVEISSVSWVGSILAPNADIAYTGGNYEGSIYCKTLSGTAEGHWYPPYVPSSVYECVCDTPAPTPAPVCPCLDQDDFPWWNAAISGDVDIKGDIEGNLAAGGDIRVTGGFALGDKLQRFTTDCDVADSTGAATDCAYSSKHTNDVMSFDWSKDLSLMVGGNLEYTTTDGASIYHGQAVFGSAGVGGSIDYRDGGRIGEADAIADHMSRIQLTMEATSDLLLSEAEKDYNEKYGQPVSVGLVDDSTHGSVLLLDTTGMAAAPIGAHLFTVQASALRDAEAVVVTHATGAEFIVVNVEDDLAAGATLELGNFQFYPTDPSPGGPNDMETTDGVDHWSQEAEIYNRQTVWNFAKTIETIKIDAVGWRGSIMAPLATVTSCNNNVLGSVYAANLDCECGGNACGELHYWPPHVDVTCVCPYEPEPEPEPTCMETCFGSEPFTCTSFGYMLSVGCSHCSEEEWTDYTDNCLASGCERSECGVRDSEISPVEVTFTEIEIAICFADVDVDTFSEVDFVEVIADGCGGEKEGRNRRRRRRRRPRVQCTFDYDGGHRQLSDGRRLSTVTATVTVASLDLGSSELNRAAQDAVAGSGVSSASVEYSDNSAACLVDDCEDCCTSIVSISQTAAAFDSTPVIGNNGGDGNDSGESGLSGAQTGGIIITTMGGIAIVAAVVLNAKKKKDSSVPSLEMCSDGTVTRV